MKGTAFFNVYAHVRFAVDKAERLSDRLPARNLSKRQPFSENGNAPLLGALAALVPFEQIAEAPEHAAFFLAPDSSAEHSLGQAAER